MKLFKYLSLSALVLVMAACGGKKEEAADENAAEDENVPVIVEDIEIIEVEDVDGEEAAEAPASSSADIDALIKNYDNLVTKYVAAAKKVAGGEITADGELSNLANDYQEAAAQLQAVAAEMTPAQASEVAKIAQKAVEAMK